MIDSIIQKISSPDHMIDQIQIIHSFSPGFEHQNRIFSEKLSLSALTANTHENN